MAKYIGAILQKIAIIGAGIAGLTAAREIKRKAAGSVELTVFEKSRGVSGRMSTRYAGDFEFDHGAQYFTAKDPAFKAFVKTSMEQGLIARWPARAFYLSHKGVEADRGGERYVATPRMNSVCKALAEPLTLCLGHRAEKLTRERTGKWTITFEASKAQSGFDQVLLAIPSVQALALLPRDFAQKSEIAKTKMEACFALMVGHDTLPDFGWDSLRLSGLPINWMAVNHSKSGRKKRPATLVVHAAPDWSDDSQDADRAWVQRVMEETASDILNVDVSAMNHRVLHRWLYASVSHSSQRPCFYDPRLKLGVCGDWCLGGRVEGAYLSGLGLAQTIGSF